MRTVIRARRAARGFSMIELLVTIALAGVIFAAMVPMFANALKKSAADNYRVTAVNLAQDRLEKVRLLDYKDITNTNLNSATIGPNWFVTSTNVGGKTYSVSSAVVPADSSAKPPYKRVTVNVTWTESYKNGSGVWVATPHTTAVDTVVKNPDAVTITTAPTPTATPTAFDVTASFKYWDDVSPTGHGYGVSIIRQVPTPVTTLSPSLLQPTASQHTVSWTNVPGGPDITYVVQCKGAHVTSMTPPFHLLTDAWLHFDTDPGN
jgi:prepilin-type N-terminal cleavage/methylation domain-containing protein